MAHPGQVPVYGCAWHPDRATAVRCVRCGRPVCPDCMRSAPVGQQCVECVQQGAKSVRQVKPLRQARAWVTWALIAVNVLVYSAVVGGTDETMAVTTSPLFRDLVLYLPWVAQGELWRTVTAGFLHFGLMHIGVNMLSLALIGPGLEHAFGRERYATIYGTALLGSSAIAMWFSPNALVAGASGAIYGLLGAALVLYLRERLNPQTIIIVLVLNIGLSISLPGISLAGHMGGLLFGVLSAGALLYYREVCRGAGVPDLAQKPSTPWVLAAVVIALSVTLIVARVLTYSG
ncbi:rhomboid family intramembrane serine protease [Mycobacteroides chelonae]|nr:rhomboid family intramembrane serine protease [Mycobacteroides chelonae]MBV0919583.1 rhomboid family intramembrane serine protease [Mycobacteroides chelonae]PKQ59408.1 rhomboid family intramembrane serine protease [Mycobacterium sp. MHSD3]GLE59438.1 rhomboid family protein [Mycobacteroides chelonae]SKO40989.1 Rhomboid family protein [Mycobacteroides abscessus subsp. bolletii]